MCVVQQWWAYGDGGLVNLWLFLNRKNERERINNVLYCK